MPQRRSHLTQTNHAAHIQATHTPVTHTQVTCNNLPPPSMYVTCEWVMSHTHMSHKQIMPHTYKSCATIYPSRVGLYVYVWSYVCICVFMPERRSHLTQTNHATHIQVTHTIYTHTRYTHASHVQQPTSPEYVCHMWMSQVTHTQVTQTNHATHILVTGNNLPLQSMHVTYEWVMSHTHKGRHTHLQQPASPEYLCHIWMGACIMSHTHTQDTSHTHTSHAQQPAPPEYLCHI